MVFLFNAALGLVLVAFQTAVVPQLPVVDNCYDLLLPYIIYQVIFRPIRESAVLVVGIGVLMGQLSGASSGLFVIVYVWVMIGVRWGGRFLHMGNYYLVPFVVAVAVMLENFFFSLSLMVTTSWKALPLISGDVMLGQIGWALISAPFFMMLLNAVHRGWAMWVINLNMDNGKASL